jgi:hypothetical protein
MAHGAFALTGTWMLGLLWGMHIPRGWSTGRRRRSGALLVVVSAWLILSGYLLYYLGDERVRAATSLLHWASGAACPLAIFAHRALGRFRSRGPGAGPYSRTAAAVDGP